jgi:succinate-semialdehyde dehydrogenase / glutarate-semialdehyde dehydrogenase
MSEQFSWTLPTGSWIGGEWDDGPDRLAVLDPGNGSTITEITRADEATCLRAVDAAALAFGSWRTTAPRARAEILRRAYELMTAEADGIAELISRENGKVLGDAKGEVTYAAEFFRWFSEEAVRLDGDLRRAPGGTNWIAVARQPVGVALLLTPWNFPAAMLTRKIGPALAAGCTVVVKPAGETPLTALYLADLLHRAGVPAGVVNVVVPDPPGPAVEAMLGHRDLRKLSFTGSTPVGRLLLSQAAQRVVNCSMELGGNAPFVVLADADVDAAVEGAMIAKMRNGGAACTAANRFVVDNAVADEFVEKLSARMTSLVVGYGLAAGTQVGALVTPAQQTRVNALVDRAIAEGAQLVSRGQAPGGGCFVAPVVLDHVSETSELFSSEVFGPVAPIYRVSGDDEALGMANNVDHGLVGYVYTKDIGKGLRFCQSIEAGMVGLNRGLVSDPAAPFGGMKESGIGREGAHDGLLAFTETQYVSVSW